MAKKAATVDEPSLCFLIICFGVSFCFSFLVRAVLVLRINYLDV